MKVQRGRRKKEEDKEYGRQEEECFGGKDEVWK